MKCPYCREEAGKCLCATPEWIGKNITRGLLSYKKSLGTTDKDRIKTLYRVVNRLQEQINEITTYLRGTQG